MIELSFREAVRADLEAVVFMLADDALGSTRERYELPLPESYVEAFEAIAKDENIELIVACQGDEIVAVMQLYFVPHLTFQGGWRATIEGVRVASAHRSKGIGQQLFEWAIERAKARNCHLVQLSTNKARPDALRFYEGLGFKASHEGMKLYLEG